MLQHMQFCLRNRQNGVDSKTAHAQITINSHTLQCVVLNVWIWIDGERDGQVLAAMKNARIRASIDETGNK